MLDIRFLRENPDVVKENIKKKFQDKKLPLVDRSSSLTPLQERSSRRRTPSEQTETRSPRR